MPSMVGTRLISVAPVAGERVEVAAGVEARQHGGRAAADPVRQHERAAGVDERRGVQHHRVGAGGDQVGQDVGADRGVAGLRVHDRLERAGRARRVEDQHRVVGLGGQPAGRAALACVISSSRSRRVDVAAAPRLTSRSPSTRSASSAARSASAGAVHQGAHPGGGEHARLLVGGQPRVQRHPDGAGLQAGEVDRDRPEAVVDQQPDGVPRRPPARRARAPCGWPPRRPRGTSATGRR